MFDTVIQGIFSSTADITLGGFLIGVGSALVLGIAMAYMYMYKNKYTKSFVITLATLPAIVSIVIMMVSGSIGAGVAVAGTFSLVRFRSVPGTAKVLTATPFGESKKNELDRVLHITVPEDLEYAGIFDDIFVEYLSQYKMIQVKTTNLGSLNKLTYNITLGKAGCEKQMIDELRCRNGNLEINITSQSTDGREQL